MTAKPPVSDSEVAEVPEETRDAASPARVVDPRSLVDSAALKLGLQRREAPPASHSSLLLGALRVRFRCALVALPLGFSPPLLALCFSPPMSGLLAERDGDHKFISSPLALAFIASVSIDTAT